MATIRKRGNRYQVQVRRQGYSPISKSFQRMSDAREWARLQETRADRQELTPDRKVLEQTKLADLVKRYRDEVVPQKKGAETETIVLNAFLRHPICRKSLANLTPADFARYRDERLEHVSPATLKRQLNPIRHMFRLAYEEWDIPFRDHPLTKVKIAGRDNQRERRLETGEWTRIIEAGEASRNSYTLPIVRFALETAMRRGEILSLRWRDIDLERSQATVQEAKNGYSRTIPLTKAATDVLQSIRPDGEPKDFRDDLVFPVTPNAFKLVWQRMLKRAGITDLHFHDLRHEAISRLFELGLTAPEVASISGHRDPRMLFRYAHANQARVREKLGLKTQYVENN